MSGEVLPSYLSGSWVTGAGNETPYSDASTGEQLGLTSTHGLDIAAAVEYGRTVGTPAISALTFHERALILRALGKLLLTDEVKAPLYALSARTGATSKDSWVDIDGGAGVLLTYASKARKELPNATVAVDGAVEPLSRDDSFSAVHMFGSRRGVAVQINAYNFPVWGMLEKFAPAFLAGLAIIVKPAPQTAFLAEACVRILLDSGELPEGALQLISGEPGNLLNLLDGQDSVAFTGSATTGRIVKSHPNLIDRSVHVTTEADSVNSAILTPNAGPGSAEFDLFVSEVVSEMTTKAGQKCTAIRRAFVPEALLGAASDALAEALAHVKVGDPADEETTMGALVDRDQCSRVYEAINQLSSAADLVTSDTAVPGELSSAGAFVPPTLLQATDRFAPVIHNVEAFGPVATLVPYATIDEAIELVGLGDGSLVVSIYGNDPAEVSALARGVAAITVA